MSPPHSCLWCEVDSRSHCLIIVPTQDPFFTPKTADEREDYGDKLSYLAKEGMKNRARQLVREIRKRKGLSVAEKIVVSAEKQRTRKR